MEESSSSDEECMILIGMALAEKNRRKRKHRMWLRKVFRERKKRGTYNLVREMAMWDKEMYFRYMRMTPTSFECLLRLVGERISKQTTNYREPVPPEQRLSVTIRHLATGESHISLSLQYRIGRQTVSKIIPETCKALYDVLSRTELTTPATAKEWLDISNEFYTKWNLPHVIGALDGKHVRVRCPRNTGSLYHNYKGYFSMVLMAVCDANYRFLLFDFGQYGSNNDSGVLLNSKMGEQLERNEFHIPAASSLHKCAFDPLPYFLVGDEIFPLKTYLMRPYPGSGLSEAEAVYNYRHSRARRVIENSFGILSARWRIFFTVIHGSVENIEKSVLACLALHNFLKSSDSAAYCPHGYADFENADGEITYGRWRKEIPVTSSGNGNSGQFQALPQLRGRRWSNDAVEMRNCLKDYVNSKEGSLSWQLNYVRRTK